MLVLKKFRGYHIHAVAPILYMAVFVPSSFVFVTAKLQRYQ